MSFNFAQQLRALIIRESAFAQAVYGERFLGKMLPAEVLQGNTKIPEANKEYDRPAHLVVKRANWMQHPGLGLWFQAAVTTLTTMRRHALAQSGCRCEDWTLHISTMWETCQAFDNNEDLRLLIEFLHCCQFTYNVDQGFVTTMGETGAIDIDVAVALAAQANSEFLGVVSATNKWPKLIRLQTAATQTP